LLLLQAIVKTEQAQAHAEVEPRQPCRTSPSLIFATVFHSDSLQARCPVEKGIGHHLYKKPWPLIQWQSDKVIGYTGERYL
jgi:hypothetical protein